MPATDARLALLNMKQCNKIPSAETLKQSQPSQHCGFLSLSLTLSVSLSLILSLSLSISLSISLSLSRSHSHFKSLFPGFSCVNAYVTSVSFSLSWLPYCIVKVSGFPPFSLLFSFIFSFFAFVKMYFCTNYKALAVLR